MEYKNMQYIIVSVTKCRQIVWCAKAEDHEKVGNFSTEFSILKVDKIKLGYKLESHTALVYTNWNFVVLSAHITFSEGSYILLYFLSALLCPSLLPIPSN